MGNENGVWIMHGLSASDPNCIHSAEELIRYIDEVGFLPLFKNEIPGFSVEEHTEAAYWWSGDEARDPWEWRAIIAGSGKVAYGKFFDKKAGFISKKWLPYFVNYRRDGYDFEGFWADGKASLKQKKIMDAMDDDLEIFSNELKTRAGFGKGGESNFDGVMTVLQMSMYICIRDFQRKVNKKGEPYGWAVAVYATPEHLWGVKHAMKAYGESPEQSRERILRQMRKLYPQAQEKDLKRI